MFVSPTTNSWTCLGLNYIKQNVRDVFSETLCILGKRFNLLSLILFKFKVSAFNFKHSDTKIRHSIVLSYCRFRGIVIEIGGLEPLTVVTLVSTSPLIVLFAVIPLLLPSFGTDVSTQTSPSIL